MDAGWPQTIDGRWIRWTAPQGESASVHFDSFAANARPDTPLPTWTIWGGNHIDRPDWTLRFSTHAPAELLQDLTFELALGQGVQQVPARTLPRPARLAEQAPPYVPPPPCRPDSPRSR
ncbi:DUF317 domain-containing protein [Streptomyces sp. NPDC102274]|uniref:DUF317 domain-containing protein n=1 Tax=Streptomyces sp. NPDC102274 TaxID=3366151 RepID=UPI00380E92E1